MQILRLRTREGGRGAESGDGRPLSGDAHRPPHPGQEDEDENETPIGDPDDDDWEGEDWDEDDDEPLRAGSSTVREDGGSQRAASRTDPAKRR